MQTESLEVWWSGALEAKGLAPGLSRGGANSTLYLGGGNWRETDSLDFGECKGRKPGRRERVKPDAKRSDRIYVMLKRGASYNAISRELDISTSVVRRIGRARGIDRRHTQGDHRAGNRGVSL